VPKTSAGWVGLGHALRAALGHRGEPEQARAVTPRFVPESHRVAPAAAAGAGEAPPAAASGTGPGAELEEISYVVSHDLGQPLNQIQRFLELLDQEADGRLGKEARGWLEQARSSASRLEGLVAGVLR